MDDRLTKEQMERDESLQERLLDDDEDDDDDEGQDGVRVGDYSLNTCDRCGGTREPFVDLPGDLLCWDCYSGQLQADADRACDEMRDRELEGK